MVGWGDAGASQVSGMGGRKEGQPQKHQEQMPANTWEAHGNVNIDVAKLDLHVDHSSELILIFPLYGQGSSIPAGILLMPTKETLLLILGESVSPVAGVQVQLL